MRSRLLALALALALAGCLVFEEEPGVDAPPVAPTPDAGPPQPTVRIPPTVLVAPTPAGCERAIVIDGFAYSPSLVEVSDRAMVCWLNRDALVHTVTFDDGQYDSGDIAVGASVVGRLPTGAHRYHCERHPWMTGNITLVAPAPVPSPVVTPPPSPTPEPAPEPTPPATPPATPSPPPTAANWTLVSVAMPARATVGQEVTLSGELVNDGTGPGSTRLSLWGNGAMSQDAAFTVAAGARAPFAFAFTPTSSGNLTVELRLPDATVLDRRTLVVDPAPAPTPTPSASPPPTPTSVVIQGFAFHPASATIPVGGTVQWTNQDGAPHSATADDGSWDSQTISNGASFSRTFPTAGTYAYHCKFHPSMTGTVTVA